MIRSKKHFSVLPGLLKLLLFARPDLTPLLLERATMKSIFRINIIHRGKFIRQFAHKPLSPTNNYYFFLESYKYKEILQYSEGELEIGHDFIQWIFPTTTQSAYNSDAPCINIRELRNHEQFPDAQEKMKQSLKLMKSHWGLKDDGSVITPKVFLLNGHNGLRFSRVLQSLVYHDMESEARSLLAQVLKVPEDLVKPETQGGRTLWEVRLEQAIKECKYALQN